VACGLLHMDKVHRDSLVYGMMECERGSVDRLVLDFLAGVKLTAGDLVRVTDGSCRLHPQLARAVVASCRVPHERLEEHARWLRSALLTWTPVDASGHQQSDGTARTRSRQGGSRARRRPCLATLYSLRIPGQGRV
jgi:hypothetical protein